MVDLIRLTDKRPDAAIKEIVETVVKNALQLWPPLQFEGEYPKSGFGIGKLNPRDIAVTNQAAAALQGSVSSSITWGLISYTATSTIQTWIDLKTDDRLYIIVTGILYLEPTPILTAMKFTANGEELAWTSLEEMQAFDIAEGWLSKPFAVVPGNQLKIEVVGTNVRNAVERIGLLGYRIAKRSYLVTNLG